MNPSLYFIFGFVSCLGLELILVTAWLYPYIKDSLRGK